MATLSNDLMWFKTRSVPEGHVVTCRGELDMSDASRLAEALGQFGNGEVTVDLSELTFMDSSGLNALIAAHQRIEQRNARLTVRGASDAVLRVIEVAGIDALLNLDGLPTASGERTSAPTT